MSAYLMQEMAAYHRAELDAEAHRNRLAKEAKGARQAAGHGDIVSTIRGLFTQRSATLRPAVNGGH